jgi:uroporphyrinogen-III synthase
MDRGFLGRCSDVTASWAGRILILRAGDSPPLAPEALGSRGRSWKVESAPILRLEPIPSAFEDFLGALPADPSTPVPWVAFSSRHTVEILRRGLEDRGLWTEARARLASCKIASIGPGTSGALTREGLRVDLEATPSTAPGLAESLTRVAAWKIVLPRNEAGSPDLPERLRGAGIQVLEIPLYRPRPDSGVIRWVLDELHEGRVQRLGFTSALEVRTLLEAMRATGEEGRKTLEGVVLGALGPVTQAELSRSGLSSRVALASRIEALVRTLADDEVEAPPA